jgi:transcriptional regulator with XRE-family HTH domain
MQLIEWKTFGVWLKSLRDGQNFSQKMLADALGCHRIHIWRLENGQRYPSRMLLHSLERIFTLSEQDKMVLKTFELMVEYKCDQVEMEKNPDLYQYNHHNDLLHKEEKGQ